MTGVKKISVILPFYNNASLLQRCVASVYAQSFSGWEIIAVDDGSTDGSGELLDRMALADSRIKVTHTENHGLSNARNVAMEQVTGDYVIFLDGDDFLHPQTMEICLHLIERDSSDAVVYTYDRTYRQRNLVRHFLHLPDSRPHFRKFSIGTAETMVTDSLIDYATEYVRPRDIDCKWAVKHCQVWRGMYRADAIRDIKFIYGIMYGDFPWWSEFLLKVRTTTILRLPLYFYYPNPRGAVLSNSEEVRIRGIQKGIEATKALYATRADKRQRALWEKRFLRPFSDKLKKKLARRG